MITVRVGKMPGRIQEVEVEEGATIAEVVEQTGLDVSGFESRINGTTVAMDTVVEEDQDILFFRKIKGN